MQGSRPVCLVVNGSDCKTVGCRFSFPQDKCFCNEHDHVPNTICQSKCDNFDVYTLSFKLMASRHQVQGVNDNGPQLGANNRASNLGQIQSCNIVILTNCVVGQTYSPLCLDTVPILKEIRRTEIVWHQANIFVKKTFYFIGIPHLGIKFLQYSYTTDLPLLPWWHWFLFCSASGFPANRL